MNLSLPKWLQPTFSINKPLQITHDDCLKDQTIQPLSSEEKDLSSATPSLGYLDDYIHQYF
ncbi:MAG: elongation factor G [Crocosphaera sp.]|nr:elongation factor G [Crocosphaera sp.]